MKKFKPVEVIWFDAQSSTEQVWLEDLKRDYKPIPSKSCGYLTIKEKNYIVLSFTLFGDSNIKHHQVIPRKMIKKIRYLK